MTRTAEQRFLSKFEVDESGCWLWTAHTNNQGYGCFDAEIDGKWKGFKAHRWSYQHFVGPIPDGEEIHHVCRVRGCVNPSHLMSVTREEHVRLDRNTHCGNGHEWTPENTYRTKKQRHCRKCLVIRTRKWRQKRKQKEAMAA